ncbi:protein SOB FIVE-LIKE 4-like [Lycium ferocissimum]|uniref:protein SOB FIVE-LIKE 4-like n=1 Tax=Lycium ferocissimum TaxID=112874 RepID=UPI002815E8C7|nr:protein SOB FIVE-LIKE 4-like [Lycium ferocissimum]
MDSNSQFFGEAEECNSSESGWTMYIGSPSNGEGDGDLEYNGDFDEFEDHNNKEAINRDDDEDGDTDDSMASDASSGPSHFSRNGKSGGVAMVHYKNPKEKGKAKDCSFTNNKAKNSVKNGYKNDQGKVKESMFATKGTKGASNGGGNKVRKSIWMGKGK